MTVSQWHIAIHALPSYTRPGPGWQYNERHVETIEVAAPYQNKPLPVTFDDAITTLESWNCLLIEPDGALVWADSKDRPWRIDAQLQDGRDRLQYVEIKTNAPRPPCEKLLTAFGSELQPLMAQLMMEGIFLPATTWLGLLDP